MTWPNSAGAAIATHSGSSVSTPEGAAGAPACALKGGGGRLALVLSLGPPLLLLSSVFGGVINKCCAKHYSVTACYLVCNRGRASQNSVTQTPPGLFVVLPGV